MWQRIIAEVNILFLLPVKYSYYSLVGSFLRRNNFLFPLFHSEILIAVSGKTIIFLIVFKYLLK